MPKDPTIRQRRNKSASRALLPAETAPREKPPRLPAFPGEEGKTWHAMARRFWHDVWSSPMRHEFVRGDEPALVRLLYLVDVFWKTGKLDIAKEVRMMEREFGLTPLSRRRLEWTVAQAEEARDLHEHKRARRAVIIDSVDPREVLA